LDRLWNPWRFQYVSKDKKSDGCIFCDLPQAGQDEENLIVHRARFNYVILNRYPYTTGHLMVVPFKHTDSLQGIDDVAAEELFSLVRVADGKLRQVYRPRGMNLGMNQGEAAGAGIAEHIHMHVLPRWIGDANFMTVIGETRILPEELGDTYRKLKAAFSE
jgi:ATP adenylyltransferase